MDLSFIIGLIIGFSIIGLAGWSCPPENVDEKMKDMTPDERKKRETKNIIFNLICFLGNPIVLLIILLFTFFILPVILM